MQKRSILLGLLFFISFSISAESKRKIVISESVNTEGMSSARASYHQACYDIALEIVNRFVQGEELGGIIASFSKEFELYDIRVVSLYAVTLMEKYRNQIRALIISGTLSEAQKTEFFEFLEGRYAKAMRAFANPEDFRSLPARYTLKALDGGKYMVKFADDNKLATVEGLTGSALLVVAFHQAIQKNYLKAALLGASGLGIFGHLGKDYFPNVSVSFNK